MTAARTLCCGCEDDEKLLAAIEAENQQQAQEIERLEDGVIVALNAIWKVYEQMQGVARKPSPALAGTPSEDTE